MNAYTEWQASYAAAIAALRALEAAAHEAMLPATCITASMCLSELADAHEFDSAQLDSRS